MRESLARLEENQLLEDTLPSEKDLEPLVNLANTMLNERERGVPGTEDDKQLRRVMAYLNANPDTDAVLTLGPTSADPTILALEEMGLGPCCTTFETNAASTTCKFTI